ncbi:hypothetical protein HO133_008102 [Letharia lupina]|uniref:Pleckstrin homology domain-containing protein n=1 Tax=Letharia lupina TaxID=560253 RepID=A0A8H6CRS6_9LECA|nr:uncharacterized protein HO133_008102 [Letharia lupina]KAF6228372.1 hypothetical protein HO133_008102 [Letharia lupina]
MALDNGYHFAAQALPTPTDTPYDSPSMSRQSLRRGSSSPPSHYSPVPLPPSEDSHFPKQQRTTDGGNVDKTSAHESRRFSANNLGISLVAQIHSLKKELGSKNNMMESLEESLHKSRAENEQLTKDVKTQKVEVTSVKKQMQSLENDMLQALEDIAKERDNAVEIIADSRKRLEDSKKKIRTQEEDASNVHALWGQDREDWDDKKRKMEGRVHMVEERLKTMVAEMLIVQDAGQKNPGTTNDVDEGVPDIGFGKGNDTSSIRAMSRLSNRSLDEPYDSKGISDVRSLRMNGLHGLGGSQMSGLSLAEELEFDEDQVAAGKEDNDQDALPEETYTSTRRYSEDKKARKVMGFHADNNEEPLGDETSGQHSIGIINDYIDFPGKQFATHYTDTGTQFSPPSSPTLQTSEPSVSEKPIEQTERAANQSRKRIAIPQIFVEQTPTPKVAEPKAAEFKALFMVSTGSQTIGRLEDPSSTAKDTSISVPAIANGMKSASTQTIEDATPLSKPANSRLFPWPTDVPVIAIHPPASRTSASRNSVMLPPRTKNAACQVAIELPRNTKSTSMQTGETRIDNRPVKLSHRLPSSDLSMQPPLRLAERRRQAGSLSGSESSRSNLRSPPQIRAEGTQPSATTARIKHAYPGDNDNGPLNHKQRSGPRRPIRSESIFAGFDNSSDDDPKNVQDHFSDDEFLNAAPVRKTLSKVQNSWKLVPHLKDSVLERLESASEEVEDEKHVSVPKAAISIAKASSQTTSKTFQTRPPESYRKASSNGKQPDIRRKALVSNGIVEHAQRGRNPSKSNALGKEPTVAPPFPVPTRSSSRKIPLSASDGAASPSPHTATFFSARQGPNYPRPLTKRKILRKVQSAAAVTHPPIPLRPQPTQSLSASSTVPPSPKSPAPRRNQFILPYDSVVELPSHPAPPPSHAGETLAETPSGQTSVVDAIAQTMVGEWMWKYVRKRTSFGITESAQAEFEMSRNGGNRNGSGVRHKRWVWLAPFERSVIWSSKQPTSGPALLGKGGRKFAIQSVLDIKDDTPPPKNADSQAIFDRSILILTPQRALKFTATSQERHYIWLTALAFLSHSTQGMDDPASPPPLPKQEYQHLPSLEPMTGFRRMPTRDSIGVAKIKRRPSIGAHSYSSPIGSIEQEIIEGAKLPWEEEEAESGDAAEPPQVHRIAAHARKRSSTGPRPVPLSAFHSYPSVPMAATSSSSLQGPTSREKYDRYTPHPQVESSRNTTHSTLTRRTTDSSIAPSPVVPDNFFDSAATVRMEAFVDRNEKEYVLTPKGKRYRTRQGRQKDPSFWGFDASAASSALESARLKLEDPFTGF